MPNLLKIFCLVCFLWGKFAVAVSSDSLQLNQPVVDQVGLLTMDQEKHLADKLRFWHHQGIMQGAVVIVDSTEGVDIFDYAMNLAERWQLGDKETDNGLLLLIAKNDRRFFILTGTGLEGALPDVSISRIQHEQLVPAFRQQRYNDGIVNTLNLLVARLEADPQTQRAMIAEDERTSNSNVIERLMPVAMLLLVFFAGLSSKLSKAVSAIVGGVCLSVIAFFVLHMAIPVAIFSGAVFCISLLVLLNQKRDGLVVIGDGGNHRSGGFSGGYSGGGGGFSGGGAGGSW